MNIKITGLAELESNLLQMGEAVAAKNLVSSAYNAASIIEKEAKANLMVDGSVRTGTLFRSIKRKKVIYPASGTVVIVVGASKGVSGYDSKGKRVVPYKYVHLVEKATSFMERAKNSTKEEIRNRLIDSLQRKLNKFLTK